MSKKIMRLMCLALTVGLLLTIAACGQRGQETTKDTSSTGDVTTATTVDIAKDNLKIAFSAAQMDANPVYWSAGIEEILSVYPNITYTKFDAGGSVEKQVQQLTEIINQEYDAIIVHATDSAALSAVTTQAEEAGINVIHINVGPEAVHSGGIENNSYNAGLLCAIDAAEKMGGAGKVVSIGPPVALSAFVFGVQGWEDTLSQYEGIEILESQAGDWTTENGNEIMRNFLSKYNNDIQAVFCHNDQMAMGAAQAIEAAGMTGKILVYGCDGLPEALTYVTEGKMTGSLYTDNTALGKSAAQLALYCIASGVDGSKLASTPIISAPAVVIDKDSVADYLK